MKRANIFEDALDLPPRLLTVAVVDPLELREHPVESEGQNKRRIGRAGVSLSSNADLLQLALARTGSDSLGEPLVQFVHVAVCQIEVSLEFLQIAAVLRQGGQPLEGDTTIRDLASRAEEELLKVGQRLTNRSGIGIGHHIHATLWIVAMETEPDVREIFELEQRLQGLKDDTGHRVNMWDREAGDLPVQTIVNHDIEQLAALALIRVLFELQGHAVQVWSVDSRKSEFPCVGALEASFEGLEGGDAQGFVQVRTVEVQAELSVNAFDVRKIGDMTEGLRREDGWNADGLQPRGGPHCEFRHSVVELPSQRLEVSRIGRDYLQLLDVVEWKFCNMLGILRSSEMDGDLGEIRRVEERDVLERDVVRVPVQSTEVGEEDVIGSDVGEGRPGGEGKVVWPGPLDLKIPHNSCIPVDTSPLVRFRSTFKVLDPSYISFPPAIEGDHSRKETQNRHRREQNSLGEGT